MNQTVKRLLISLGVLAILGGLLAGAVAVIDPWVRDRVEDAVAQEFASRIGAENTGQVTVTTGGFMMIPQAVGGKLDEVTISAEDAGFGTSKGSLRMNIKGLPINPDLPFTSGTMFVAMDGAKLANSIVNSGAAPIDGAVLEEGLLHATKVYSVFGFDVTVDVWFSVAAQDNNVTLTPVRVAVDGADISVEDAVAKYGDIASAALAPQTLCVAQFFPKGLTLTSLETGENSYTFNFTMAPMFISDPTQREDGVCG